MPLIARRVFEAQNLSRNWHALNELPQWVESFRPSQIAALEEIEDAYKRVPLVVVDAPTGSGKSLLGEATRRLLDVRGLYVCHSKQLQDQYVRDFPYAEVLKGRSNYPTELYKELFYSKQALSCADCTKTQDEMCQWCERVSACPYEMVKQKALTSDVAVLNTSYWLTESNGPGKFANNALTIFDECDTLEEELMGYVEARVSDSRCRKHDLGTPDRVTKDESWARWIDLALPVLRGARAATRGDSLPAVRERLALDRVVSRLSAVGKGLQTDDWVYTGQLGEVSFRPTTVHQMGKRLIWKHSNNFLLMSATVISAKVMLEELGWDDGYEVVTLPSTFPVENRPVVVQPIVEVTHKISDDDLDRLAHHVSSIIARHPGQRVLLHCVSYRLGQALCDRLQSNDGGGGRPIYFHASAADKQRAYSNWQGTAASVLISPSLDRGVDLPGDMCRVQIIVKIPYPNLGDRQISKRRYREGGEVWYMVKTIRSMVQMTGRIVRSESDWGTTYILDKGFIRLWRQWKNLIPMWWRDAVNF